ncbi:MAG: hypothetical protein OEZ11_00285, partial [Gammaproteobacteria bacterium]|nr:hypothetical protein [Gammaproteobacteria bacterium]
SGMTQAAARTFPLVFTDVRNQIEIVIHDSSPYPIDFARVYLAIANAQVATNPRKGAHLNVRQQQLEGGRTGYCASPPAETGAVRRQELRQSTYKLETDSS